MRLRFLNSVKYRNTIGEHRTPWRELNKVQISSSYLFAVSSKNKMPKKSVAGPISGIFRSSREPISFGADEFCRGRGMCRRAVAR